MKEIVYIDVNNWTCGEDYPNKEPFLTWMTPNYDNPRNIIYKFEDDNWCKENKLVVVCTLLDMSLNFNIIATREWIERNCPYIIGSRFDYTDKLERGSLWDEPVNKLEKDLYLGFWGHFLPYREENYGVWYEMTDARKHWKFIKDKEHQDIHPILEEELNTSKSKRNQ